MDKKIQISTTTYVPMDLILDSVLYEISLQRSFVEFGVIQYCIKKVKPSTIFKKGYAIITVLVPEDRYVEFYKANLQDLNSKLSLGHLLYLIAGLIQKSKAS